MLKGQSTLQKEQIFFEVAYNFLFPCDFTYIEKSKTYKAELAQEGILFRTQFPSMGIFINKKVGFRKN